MQLTLDAKNKFANSLLFIFGVLLFFYTSSRAYLLSITWDEAYTYLEFVRQGIVIPQKYVKMSANNHLLNTWMEIYFVKWFGVSEFVLRLPSVLSHILFLFFSAKLLKNFENRWIAVASFLIINLNPYMLDFFSLARGYGLSLGLMMASIYYLYELQTKNKYKYAVPSIVLASLAVFANFVMLNYFLVLFGIIGLTMACNEAKSTGTSNKKIISFLKGIWLPTVIMFFLLATALPVIFKLKEAGALFSGGYQSFWADTVCETIGRNCYDIPYNVWLQRLSRTFMLFILLFAAAFIGFKFFKNQMQKLHVFLASLLLIIALCSLSTIIEHHLFGTPYLAHRMTLYLIVLFNLIFILFINELIKKTPKAVFVSYLTVVIVLIHFTLAFNLKYVVEWKFDADTKTMLVDLEKIYHEKDNNKKIILGDTFWFFQSINFYKDIQNLNWIGIQTSTEHTLEHPGYLYITNEEFLNLDKDSIEVIKTYPLTTNKLVKINQGSPKN